jgi:hypothetical protein
MELIATVKRFIVQAPVIKFYTMKDLSTHDKHNSLFKNGAYRLTNLN